MTQVEVTRERAGGYKVDVTRAKRVGRVSSKWFSRPADERSLSLSDLYAALHGRIERSRTRTVESSAIRVEANRDDAAGRIERRSWVTSGAQPHAPNRPAPRKVPPDRGAIVPVEPRSLLLGATYGACSARLQRCKELQPDLLEESIGQRPIRHCGRIARCHEP